ncbi:MAG: hypothetical protein FWC41_06330 [Firmicutes bacterium]|nr:hypothetical protein [Bacillota bacterium]
MGFFAKIKSSLLNKIGNVAGSLANASNRKITKLNAEKDISKKIVSIVTGKDKEAKRPDELKKIADFISQDNKSQIVLSEVNKKKEHATVFEDRELAVICMYSLDKEVCKKSSILVRLEWGKLVYNAMNGNIPTPKLNIPETKTDHIRDLFNHIHKLSEDNIDTAESEYKKILALFNCYKRLMSYFDHYAKIKSEKINDEKTDDKYIEKIIKFYNFYYTISKKNNSAIIYLIHPVIERIEDFIDKVIREYRKNPEEADNYVSSEIVGTFSAFDKMRKVIVGITSEYVKKSFQYKIDKLVRVGNLFKSSSNLVKFNETFKKTNDKNTTNMDKLLVFIQSLTDNQFDIQQKAPNMFTSN